MISLCLPAQKVPKWRPRNDLALVSSHVYSTIVLDKETDK